MILSVFAIVFVARSVFGVIAVGIDDNTAMRIVFDVIASTLTAPLGALVAAIIYFRLRELEGGQAEAPVPAPVQT